MTGLLTEPTTAELRLVEPMPGFEEHLDFTLDAIDPDGLLLAMRSRREPGLRFVLSPADIFFAGYAPRLPDDVRTALGVTAADPLRVLVMLTVGDVLADATANLRAPVVVAGDGEGNSTALQVVLDDDTLSMHEPILPAAPPD